jgi:vacuolar protein sorting-associated protein 13D
VLTKDWMVIERRGGLRQTTVTSGNTNDPMNKRTEVQMRLAGGIGISLINGVPEELVFATFNPIEVSFVAGCAETLRVLGLGSSHFD